MKRYDRKELKIRQKLGGTNNLVNCFCIFPYSDELVKQMQQGMLPFMRPFEVDGNKYLLALDVIARKGASICKPLNVEYFVITYLTSNGFASDYYRKKEKSLPNDLGYQVQESVTEVPYQNRVEDDHLRVKMESFNVDIPLSVFLDCVNDIDEFVAIRKKTYEYNDEKFVDDFFWSLNGAGMSWYYSARRFIGAYKTAYWK